MFFLLVGVLLSVLIYYKLIKSCDYWKEQGIKHAKSWPLVGSMGKVMIRLQAAVDVGVNLYKKYPEERYVGYMQLMQPRLLIRDIELVKQIAVKDFNHFTDHVFSSQSTETDLILSKSLISLTGEKWKDMRSTLSPAFTSSKMRNMYLLIDECAENFVQNFNGEVELEMKDVFSKFACNVIASVVFGIQIDCMKDPDNEFRKMGVALSQFTTWQTIKILFWQAFPSLARMMKVEVFPTEAMNFFRCIVNDNIKKREAEGIIRPDMIHLLMEAKKGKLKSESTKNEKNEGFAATEETEVDATAKKLELTDEDIVAQAMFFFSAGFDTVSTGASFMAYELGVNPEVQEKLREEIDEFRRKYNNKIPYEGVLGMKYLDQVVSETLRLWPPAFEADRLCVKDYIIQPKNPGEKRFCIRKGAEVLLPIMAIHRDDQYYPEPERFDPERFNDENKVKIVPGTYLPFGWGPRNCIGSRFALLELKTLFCHLLSKFEIVPVARTEIPIKMCTKTFNIQPKSGFWLGFKPRK